MGADPRLDAELVALKEGDDMVRAMRACGLVVLAVLLAAVAGAQEKAKAPRPVPQTPEWQRLTSLVGQWEGSVEEGSKKIPTIVEVRMTGDGSAVMHLMGKDTPQEMVTMFHPDGERLLATHYCAVHNQPRMAMVKAPGPSQVAFEFVDGTNIGPGDGHMKGLVITFIDADHHDEAWTWIAGGESGTSVFHYTRKK
jgi:hypothetical protein